MTCVEIQQIVQVHLDESIQEDVLIMEESTEEVFCGWVFYYQSKQFIETSDFRHALAGNAPVLYDLRDGSMHFTGTGNTIDYYIQNYRETGDTHVERETL